MRNTRTIPPACPVCRGSRYVLRVEPVLTALCGAGLDFARDPCPRCDGSGTTLGGFTDMLDPAYYAPLPFNHDMIRGCAQAAISGEIFVGGVNTAPR